MQHGRNEQTQKPDCSASTAFTPGQQTSPRSLQAIAIPGIPEVHPHSDLGAIIGDAIEKSGHGFLQGDVIVAAQKIVSKAEGRHVDLANVKPGARAIQLANETGKDARLVEVILSESNRVVRHRLGVLIVEHRLGFVLANAGVDQSNVNPATGSEPVLLLPENPDASAERLRAQLAQRFNCEPAVIINDSFGRPWRLGTTGTALGAAGLPALMDMRGRPDLFNRPLYVTEVGFADEIAATASLLMGQANEGCPVVLIRGLTWSVPPNPAASLLRNHEQDLFR